MEIIKDLPEIFDEFEDKKKQSFLKVKEYKEKQIPIIGAYCSFFPREIAVAMGAIPVGLCSSANETVELAETVLPKNVCPLIKSSYGYAISDRCPYFHFADLVVGETTCDGKKKMYELMSEFKEVYVMELPNTQSEGGLRFWREEIIRFKEFLEEYFQVVITENDIRRAIVSQNKRRKALKRFYGLMKLEPVPMSGLELGKVLYGSKYQFGQEEMTKELNELSDRILEEYEKGRQLEKRPRILITGCPMGEDTNKIVEAIENNGGVVVGFENCTGAKAVERMVDEDDSDVYGAIARKYFSIGCAIMTPNNNRIHLLGEIGLFARLFVGGLRGDHLGRGLIDRLGLGGDVRRRGLGLALRLEPNDGIQNVAVGGVERCLGIGVAHVALGADGFNFFEVVHDLSFRSMGATPGDLPGRERCVRRPALRRSALGRTL